MAWLTGWNRRKPKLVKGSTAGAQTDYQLKLTVYKGSGIDTVDTIYLGGHVNDDFSDLRFTSSDETTLLPYWIESYTSGVSAIVWIKIDSIPADPFSKFIYVYYDNPVATTVSSGTTTFELFEDFETYPLGQTLIGQNGWMNNEGGAPGTNSNVLIKNDRVRHGNQSLRLYSVNTSRQDAEKNVNFTTDIAIEWDMQTTKPIDSRYAWMETLWFASPSGYITDILFDRQYDGYGTYISCGQQRGLQTYSPNTWYKIRLVIKFATKKFDIYIDNVLRANNLSFSNTGATGLGRMGFDIYTEAVYGPYDIYGWIDTVRYSKYASPEPIWDESSSEQTYTANLTVSSTPTGAEIWINSIDQGVTTTGWFILNPGTYSIMLTKPGYEDYIEITTLESNVDAIVHKDLIPIGCVAPVCNFQVT